MSSLRKRIANRENGKLSGPVTPEGRAKSALNSIKHGLTANTLVLTNESRDMFNELLDAYTERFQPADEVELDLILEMVACRWRLRRIMSVETAMVDIEMDDQEEALAKDRGAVDEVCRIALAFTKLSEGRGLTLLSRYEARFRRQFDRALANLRDLQNERKSKQVQEDPPHQDMPAPPVSQIDQTNPPARPEPPVLRPIAARIPQVDPETPDEGGQ